MGNGSSFTHSRSHRKTWEGGWGDRGRQLRWDTRVSSQQLTANLITVYLSPVCRPDFAGWRVGGRVRQKGSVVLGKDGTARVGLSVKEEKRD